MTERHTKMPDQRLHHVWRKSSYSSNTGECVEIADLVSGVGVRDSRDPDGPVLVFGRGAMADLAARIRDGHHES